MNIDRANERLERCRKLERTHDENQQMYDEWCATYDEDHILLQCQGHKTLAQIVADIYPLNREDISILDMACGTGAVGVEDHILLQCQGHKTLAQIVADIYPLNREDISILDMACGTGAVGVELQRHGFKSIDGLDANENMMKYAREKNIHLKEFVELVPDEGHTSIPSESYNVVTCRGGFGSGALPVNAILEMLRIVKPGGHIVIATIHDYFEVYPQYMNKVQPLMSTLEHEKRWKKIKEEVMNNYLVSVKGILFVYEKL